MKEKILKLYSENKKTLIIILAALILMISFWKPIGNFLLKDFNFLGFNVGGSYGGGSYGGSYAPSCGSGYIGGSNSCMTGKPTNLCRTGIPSNLKFTSVQNGKNEWTWNCTENRKTISCEVKDASQCVILSAEGYGFGGYFTSEIEDYVKSYSCGKGYKNIRVVKLGSHNDDISELAFTIENTLKYFYNNKDQNEKILVAGHSMGAVSGFLNEIIYKPGMDTDFLYYDPPYNHPWIKTAYLLPDVFISIANIFSKKKDDNGNDIAITIKNGELIYFAKKNGLTGEHPRVIDWSGGYDDPDSEEEKRLHSLYWHEKGQHFDDIKIWIDAECRR